MIKDLDKIKPLQHYVLIKSCKPEILQVGSITVPVKNATFKFEVGVVCARSSKVVEEIKVGDIVTYEKGSDRLFYNDEVYAIIREIDIGVILKNFSDIDISNLYRNNIKSVGGKKVW